MFNANPSLNLDLMLSEMDHFNDDINTTKDKLRRDHYPNGNTFKTYMNILWVISPHFKELLRVYQPLTKKEILSIKKFKGQEETDVDEWDKCMIVSLKPDSIHKNLDVLENIEDRMIYAIYTTYKWIYH